MSSDHSSLVTMFKEKFRPKYRKSGDVNSGYIKENVYFNGVALKESLLHDNDNPETQTSNRLLTHNNKTICTNENKCFELEKGCFIYQNPTNYYDDNVSHKFTDMSLVINSYSFDNKTFDLKKNNFEGVHKHFIEPRKSSLESRLQNGSNLELCFMNEHSSDTELPAIDRKVERIQNLKLAKNRAIAHMISDERSSVISDVIRRSLSKVGIKLDHNRRRVSRQFLMRLNFAQLQIIVNDLHSYIEYLNESLVNLLLERDELHMAKDSILVDIEDLKHVTHISSY